MITVKSAGDAHSKRNIEAVLAFYEKMIHQKKPLEAVQEHLKPEYIQHNPVVPTLALGLGNFFNGIVSARANARVVVHQIIAAEDHVWAHVNFLNLFNDNPDDRGVAGVDIYRFDNTDGKVIEHWDVLQPIPDPLTAANQNGMF
jgi:predicted SnoaL-like aldol condensation-catalyzing enzyme